MTSRCFGRFIQDCVWHRSHAGQHRLLQNSDARGSEVGVSFLGIWSSEEGVRDFNRGHLEAKDRLLLGLRANPLQQLEYIIHP